MSLIIDPNGRLPFEMIFDASHYAVWEVLDQRNYKLFCIIIYVIKVLNGNQINYTLKKRDSRNNNFPRKNSFIFYWFKGYCVHGSCNLKTVFEHRRIKTSVITMGHIATRV